MSRVAASGSVPDGAGDFGQLSANTLADCGGDHLVSLRGAVLVDHCGAHAAVAHPVPEFTQAGSGLELVLCCPYDAGRGYADVGIGQAVRCPRPSPLARQARGREPRSPRRKLISRPRAHNRCSSRLGVERHSQTSGTCGRPGWERAERHLDRGQVGAEVLVRAGGPPTEGPPGGRLEQPSRQTTPRPSRNRCARASCSTTPPSASAPGTPPTDRRRRRPCSGPSAAANGQD
jgi:hypothetical protein